MLGAVGTELKFVNPELSWKTATKRFRRKTRSSRSVKSRISNSVILDASDEGFESEKHGVAVLGQRFADHLEHVPLKRRIFMLHSSKPLVRSKSSSQRSKKIKTRNGKSDTVFSLKDVDNSLTDGKPPNFITGKVHVDFSGIALLAATACSITINDDGHCKDESTSFVSSTAKHIDSVASMELLKESTASVGAVSKFVKDLEHERESSEPKPSDGSFFNNYPDGGKHGERLSKRHGSDTCGYPGLHLISPGKYPVDRKLCKLDKSSIEMLEDGQSKIDLFVAHDTCSDPLIEGKLTSIQGVEHVKECSNSSDVQSKIELIVAHDACSDPQIEGSVTSIKGIDHMEECTIPHRLPEMFKTEACQMVTGECSLNGPGIISSSHVGSCLFGTIGEGRKFVPAENIPSQDKEVSPDKPTINSAFPNGESSCIVADYESPFEDGELREGPILNVDGNEFVGEINCLDNGEDLETEHNASNCCPPGFSSLNFHIVRKEKSPENVLQHGTGDEMKEPTQSPHSNTKFPVLDRPPEDCEASNGKSVTTKIINEPHDKAKASERKRLFSHLEGSSRSEHRKDVVYARPNNTDKACVIEEREVGSKVRRVNYTLKDRDKKGYDCTGSLWGDRDSRSNNYVSSYHPQDKSRRNDSKPRGSHYNGERRSITYSAKGYGPSLTRSPGNRDDSRNRSRGRRHAISPVSIRRTRPHPLRHLQRERAIGAKRRSRSPDLRFEARMERKRSPFTKYSFFQDDIRSSSGRFPPKYHPKWKDNRNNGSDRISRMFDESHRFDPVDSRHMVRRGSKYDSCGNKNEMIHSVRHHDNHNENRNCEGPPRRSSGKK